MVFFAVIIGAFGKLLVHAFDFCLHFEKDAFESQFRLLYYVQNITLRIWDYHLLQVTKVKRGIATTVKVGCVERPKS